MSPLTLLNVLQSDLRSVVHPSRVPPQTSRCFMTALAQQLNRLWSRDRFQAVLLSRGTESTFQIIETNDFKQLAHISLAFRPGSDATVKTVRALPYCSTGA